MEASIGAPETTTDGQWTMGETGATTSPMIASPTLTSPRTAERVPLVVDLPAGQPLTAPRGSASERGDHTKIQPHPGGLLGGAAMAVLAMTPSLLPHGWILQGVVSGLSGAFGYAMAVLVACLLRRWARWCRIVSAVARDRSSTALVAAAAAVAVLGMSCGLLTSLSWQRELADRIGTTPPTVPQWLLAGPLLVLVVAICVAVARIGRLASRRVAILLRHRLRFPRTVAAVTAAALVATLVLVLVNDVLLTQALSLVDRTFSAANHDDHAGVVQPQDPDRPGSPASLTPWSTLGREGRAFVAGVTTSEELAATPAGVRADPVRVYAGLETAPEAAGRAALAVAELERTGGFDRSVLLIATSTGSGWVNDATVDSLELMYGGDVATVATQYSYLPSWLSFLLDRTRAEHEATALLDAVEAHVDQMPAGSRPRVLVDGESLGAFGSQGALASLAGIRARTSGVLWAGPPNDSALWRGLVDRRDGGSTATAPIYADGLLVRFAGDRAQIDEPGTAWEGPRVLYLQHPSDPVVWWSPELVWRRPDWLPERASGDGPTMRWYPLVTFLQVSADLVVSKAVPDGYGHNYNDLSLDGWAAVAPPAGWTPADTEQVRAILHEARDEPAR